MKSIVFFVVVLVFFATGCDLRKREDELTKREASLNQREQELLLKETSLQLKEEELVKREKKLDSTVVDSTVYNPAITGIWDVRMTCTETSCSGSAVGDTKTETWEIGYQENSVIARAMANNQLARVYSGVFTGNTLELVETRDAADNQPATRMVVRLRLSSNNLMEGNREIERIGQCKIIYETVLNKKDQQP